MADKYFVTQSDMVGVADKIRAKSGKAGTLVFPDGWKQAIDDLSVESLLRPANYPDYVKKEIARVADNAIKVITGESIVSICMSDSHFPADEETRTSGVHAAMAIKALTYLLPVDFIAHLGDVGFEGITSTETTTDRLEANLAEMLGYIREGADSFPLFVAIGNHDPGNYITKDDDTDMVGGDYLYRNFTALSASADTVFSGEATGGYCYRDFTAKKVRVFLLNSAEGIVTGGYDNDTGCSTTQLAWFASKLQELNTKSDAADWGVVVLCHYPADYGAARPLSNVIAAYVGGTSITLDGTAYNFSGQNAARFLVQYHGHIHNFLVDRLYTGNTPTQYDAYRVCIPNTQYNRENYYGEFSGIQYSEDTSYPKTPGTAKDTSFVVNVINPSEQRIYSICFGAGYDRTISLEGITYYSIHTDLTGATVESNATSIKEGDSYTGMITVTEGYTLDSVTVTMDGEDITADVYADGVVTIPKVTGAVVITVVAKAPPVNLLTLALDTDGSLYNGGLGYKSGYRISTSSGTEKASTGSYVSGYIPVNLATDTLKLYNIGTDAVNDSKAWMIGFNNLGTSVNGQVDLASLTPDEDGSLTIGPDKWAGTDLTAVKYVRLSCSYIGDDSNIIKEV